ncbi:hypothetical protein M011DRAFT_436303 [Sporormia fimetaria CBS 119925]|uniref:F-box domain-containing protein n=1 Tax=Sporormia fimetaria CBS 119925 TaxID=1340428 RepID=A0A6A6VP10_9PLEO|nr:hypothetical protein M011DRAFT_436303 [Sporormia fimetaria CBS 119925]
MLASMQSLPDELIIHILSYLEPAELATFQLVSKTCLKLGRDKLLWKTKCFENSATERRRRRQQLDIPANTDPRLTELLRAANSITSTLSTPTSSSPALLNRKPPSVKKIHLANWDPSYPSESTDFYQEYIQRHAPCSLSWFQHASYGHRDDNLHHEATGAGILFDSEDLADKLIAPLEDGSISIWDVGSTPNRGLITARSAPGILANRGLDLDYETRFRQSQAIMTDTGAVECVSIDSVQKKGFFSTQNTLNEVDLHTLQVISRTPYPFPIHALSEARHPTPLTIGTMWTLHLHDTRTSPKQQIRTELIGGTPSPTTSILPSGTGSHVSLSQPGPQSILHIPASLRWNTTGDVWVGGRFTSFLSFDRRFFPRLNGTLHSGAKTSSLAAIPYPFIPPTLRSPHPRAGNAAFQETKSKPGLTLISAGSYKGKGSLELYSLPREASPTTTPLLLPSYYHNRQTASSSGLLSVTPHGARLVFSDGNGNLKWVERDGSTPVRTLNINDVNTSRPQTRTREAGAGQVEAGREDFVRKILPAVDMSLMATMRGERRNVPVGRDDLVVWTGEGRLGMVGFGGEGFDVSGIEDEAKEEEVRVLRERERGYGIQMRRALEQQARELRWLRGYGL